MNKVQIIIDENGLGSVWLNGKELELVTGIKCDIEAGKTPQVTISVSASLEWEIDAVHDVLKIDKQLTAEEVEYVKRRWKELRS
jgi:hypothetical protein